MPRLSTASIRGILALKAFWLLAVCPAIAQNLSSVSGPTVSAGDREVEYRLGWIPDGDSSSLAHRFALGASLNERTSLKVTTNFADRPGQPLRFRNINAEYRIEMTPEDARIWQSGIRFDARLSNGPAPERLGFHWLNQWQVAKGLRARAQLIATRQIGSNANNLTEFELRSSLIWKANEDYTLSLLSFTTLGDHRQFGLLQGDQQLGPTLSGPLGKGIEWTVGTLFGLSENAPDHDLRFWISKEF